jgi:phosphatidate phosphatase PAH1
MKSTDKEIVIHVNGTKTDLKMKLGSAGEAYFVSEAPTLPQPILALAASSSEPIAALAASSSKPIDPRPRSLSEHEAAKFTGIFNKKEDEEVKIEMKIEAQRANSDSPVGEVYDSEEDICTIELSLSGDQLNEEYIT